MANDREGRGVDRRPGKAGAKRLSADERALWEHAAQSIHPIKGKKGRVHPAQEAALSPAPATADGARGGPAEPPLPLPKKPHRVAKAAEPSRVVVLPTPAAPSPLALERRKARRLSSGRIEIEARIDLHGMRQAEAHTALRRFLLRAYAEGKRWVLVITGKGAPQRTAHDERLAFEGGERGVLRRNVPRWLAEPELAPVIIGFTVAAIKHGGEGALYVHLRKRAGPG